MDYLIKILQREFVRRNLTIDACIVDQYIETSQKISYPLKDITDFVPMSYIKVFDNDSVRIILLKLLSYPEQGLIRHHVGHNHLPSLESKALCSREPDACVAPVIRTLLSIRAIIVSPPSSWLGESCRGRIALDRQRTRRYAYERTMACL
jgi:hypothetical protein